MISPIITAVFAIVYLLTTIWLCRGVKLDARGLCLGGVICALTLVLASIRIPLPTGSNITCGSWIPLMLLALVYDYKLAMLTGWVCGILVMILIPGWQAVHWAQIFVQQRLAHDMKIEVLHGTAELFRDGAEFPFTHFACLPLCAGTELTAEVADIGDLNISSFQHFLRRPFSKSHLVYHIRRTLGKGETSRKMGGSFCNWLENSEI